MFRNGINAYIVCMFLFGIFEPGKFKQLIPVYGSCIRNCTLLNSGVCNITNIYYKKGIKRNLFVLFDTSICIF